MSTQTPTTASPALASHLVTVERLHSITTLIGRQTVMHGDLMADSRDQQVGIKIDGRLEGSVVIANGGIIWVGPHGDVNGQTIEADQIFIAGKVRGNVKGRHVELTGTCTVHGNIEYSGCLNTHNLAQLRGSVQFTDAPKA